MAAMAEVPQHTYVAVTGYVLDWARGLHPQMIQLTAIAFYLCLATHRCEA